jgi:hypothetical protein
MQVNKTLNKRICLFPSYVHNLINVRNLENIKLHCVFKPCETHVLYHQLEACSVKVRTVTEGTSDFALYLMYQNVNIFELL